MKPICVPCQRFYRPKKNGVHFVEGMPMGNNILPGRADPDHWKPYKLWSGDLWECPDCLSSIIVGTAREPIREQHEPDFLATIVAFGSMLQVNDC